MSATSESVIAGEAVADAWRAFERDELRQRDAIRHLVSVPTVSAPGFPAAAMQRGADAVAELLRRAGLENVGILESADAPPYVYGDWLHAKSAPTVLLYSHYDVQPPGRSEDWTSPPFSAEVRDGRLFGRGAADDKGGLVAQIASVSSLLSSSGALPCNVRFLVDGEEEVGSPHLAATLEKHRERFAADVVVVTDTPNPQVGIPGMTCSLRGNCLVDVEVRCLSRPLHSGRGGGLIPDPVQILGRLLGSLQKSNGRLDVPGLYPSESPTTRRYRRRIRSLELDEALLWAELGAIPDVRSTREPKLTAWEQIWCRPSLTVIAISAPGLTGANQISDTARARLSLRTVPELDTREAGELLVRRLMDSPPYGARIEAHLVMSIPWWRTETNTPEFEAAQRALRAGYGVEPRWIGAGGSIGFLAAIAATMGSPPCLLLGIEDPQCNAHSLDEGLHLGDWARCTRSLIHLLHELPVARRERAR